MSIILWLIFGAVVGWLASLIVTTEGGLGLIGDIVVGIIGAFIGGFLSSLVGGPSVTGFNLGSIIVAVIGAVILIAIVSAISGGRSARPTV